MARTRNLEILRNVVGPGFPGSLLRVAPEWLLTIS